MPEYCLVNDEGVVEDGFFSREAAEQCIADDYSPEDELEVDLRERYDADGQWIEDNEDGDDD